MREKEPKVEGRYILRDKSGVKPDTIMMLDSCPVGSEHLCAVYPKESGRFLVPIWDASFDGFEWIGPLTQSTK